MEFKRLKHLRELIKSKIETYFSQSEEKYPCLIFISHLQQFVSFQNTDLSLKMRFFALFNFILFQLMTIPMFLSLVFVSTKSYKVFYLHMFDSLYCVACLIEYVFLLVSYKGRTKFLRHFHQFFIRNHCYVKKIMTAENVLSTILVICILITMITYHITSINTTLIKEELLLINRKYPERKFKSDFLLPFDYSLTPYFEIMVVMIIYYGFLLQTTLFDVITTMPFISFHIKGQLDIIAFYLRSIGKLLFLSIERNLEVNKCCDLFVLIFNEFFREESEKVYK
ncbi:hypothetical protein WDU94_012045 [Cyamophila willieti]